MGYLFYLCLIAFFLCLNAVFNGAETGLVTLDLDYLKFKTRTNPAAKKEMRLLKIAKSPEKFLAVTLLGINSCLVISSALLTALLREFGHGWLQLGTFFESIFIFLFCEFFPKMVFSDRPLKFCLKSLPILIVAEIIFYIPVKLLTALTRFVMRLFKIQTDMNDGKLSRDELLILLSHGLSSGTIEEQSGEMAKGIIKLRDTTVKEIMIPRTKILALEIDTPIEVARKTVIKSGFSRVPVYRKEIDQIVGILYFKDLFLKGDSIKSLSEILLKPLFVPEMKPALGLFREMREKAAQVAIVLDEYATICGIVTFEDLVEEVVGEIHDEFDKPRANIKQNEDGSLAVRGDTHLVELNEFPEFSFASKNGVTTINGLIQANLGRIPAIGESFMIEGFKMKVVSSDDRKIEWLIIFREQNGK
ncbi:MAG: CNNM domain-containing protein [Candidatus Rifleibacteriota bacterium]